MGNAPSSQVTPQQSAAPLSEQRRSSAPAATSALPISTSSANPTASHRQSIAFHSGFTPPTAPPSPPPPSTPPLLPFAGHLSPQNPHCLSHPQAHDYSKSTVTKLILEAKLAPFYRGLEDYEEDWMEEDVGRILKETREKDYEEGVTNSYTERLREEREAGSGLGIVTKKIGISKNKESRREIEKEEREKRERKAYMNALECPICFLSYPPNINTSRCCQQPVCTECFVQIKRNEATTTHLESEPACCPFCVETDFGVIYERPLSPMSSLSSTALAASADQGNSSLSQAFSVGSDAELAIGPGMNPKQKETMRRKSVSSKAMEVVTIDEIRPDWEAKLNAVKAAAARKASRRIVMRQVGDRLVPIGYTSSRAPGTADFTMSVPPTNSEETGSPRRSRRRESDRRQREAEEAMIEEAMRLSLLDHEEHLRKQADVRRGSSTSATASTPPQTSTSPATMFSGAASSPGPVPGPSTSAAYAATPSSPQTSSSRRASTQFEKEKDKSGEKQSGTSKLKSKFNNVRARANSASTKSLGMGNKARGNSTGGQGSSGSVFTSSPTTGLHPTQTSNSVSPINSNSSSSAPSPVPGASSHNPHNIGSSGLNPTSPVPMAVAPVTTLASPGAIGPGMQKDLLSDDASAGPSDVPSSGTASAGFHRLSMDMPALAPDSTGPTKASASLSGGEPGSKNDSEGGLGLPSAGNAKPHFQRAPSAISELTEPEDRGVDYAQLESDEE